MSNASKTEPRLKSKLDVNGERLRTRAVSFPGFSRLEACYVHAVDVVQERIKVRNDVALSRYFDGSAEIRSDQTASTSIKLGSRDKNFRAGGALDPMARARGSRENVFHSPPLSRAPYALS